MAQLFVIAMFVALHASDTVGMHESALPHWLSALLTIGPLMLLWFLFHASARIAGIELDRHGRLSSLGRVDATMKLCMVFGGFVLVGAMIWWGWLDAVRAFCGNLVLVGDLGAVLPGFLYLCALWWSIEPVERRVKEAVLWRSLHEGLALHPTPSRLGYVWDQFRHQAALVAVPMVLVTVWNDAVLRLGAWVWADKIPTWWASWGEPAAEWGGVLVILVSAPALLRRVWTTFSLREGPVFERAIEMCRDYHVRVQGPLVWHTRGTVVNAAILGVFWPLRYLLLTDAMLERMEWRQVEGVLAHEIAHVRHHHMVWLALSVVSVVLATGWLETIASNVLHVPEEGSLAFESSATVLSLGASIWAFGAVSRLFEWQADAFAVRHLSGASPSVTPDAANVMSSTLQAVADLNGVPVQRYSWRHGSIAERQRRIGSMIGLACSRLPIDSQVRRLKLAIVVGLVVMLVPVGVILVMGWKGA